MQQVQSSFDILRANFDEAYAGNRAPMPLYVHGFFLKHGSNLADVERFIGEAAAPLGSTQGWWGGACGCPALGSHPTHVNPPPTCLLAQSTLSPSRTSSL